MFVSTVRAAEAVKAPTATNSPRAFTFDFQPNLPIVALDARTALDGEVKVPCTIRLMATNDASILNVSALPGMVRYHGASSQGFPKKSFSLTLDKPARLLDLRESAHWVLNAAFIDRSLMRHKLSYDLFRSLSAKGTPRFAVASRFVEVYFNGRYNGAYLLMERMDRQLLNLQPFRSNAVDHACVYKAVDHAANFGRPGHAGYEQREPDPQAAAYWKPLDELDGLTSSSTDIVFFAEDTGIGSRLDLDNAIDFHLLVLFTSNMDGITKNFMIARDAPTKAQPKPRFFFAPWDYDATFGRNWDGTRVSSSEWLSNHLFDRLMGNAAYRKRVASRWEKLRDRQFSTANVHAMINANARTLDEAARRNALRWRVAAGIYPDSLSFEQDIAQMKSWVEERGRWLDAELARRAAQP